MKDELTELIHMADVYANKCTRQYEKFDHYKRSGIPWSWEDCEAAYELVRELPNYWGLMTAYRRYGDRGVQMVQEGVNIWEAIEPTSI